MCSYDYIMLQFLSPCILTENSVGILESSASATPETSAFDLSPPIRPRRILLA